MKIFFRFFLLIFFLVFLLAMGSSLVWLGLRLWPAAQLGQAAPLFALSLSGLMLLYLLQVFFYYQPTTEGLLISRKVNEPLWQMINDASQKAKISSVKKIIITPQAHCQLDLAPGLFFIFGSCPKILLLGRETLETLSPLALQKNIEEQFFHWRRLNIYQKMGLLFNWQSPLDFLYKKIKPQARPHHKGWVIIFWLRHLVFCLPFYLMAPIKNILRPWAYGLFQLGRSMPDDVEFANISPDESSKRKENASLLFGQENWQVLKTEIDKNWPRPTPPLAIPKGRRAEAAYYGFYQDRRASAQAPWPIRPLPSYDDFEPYTHNLILAFEHCGHLRYFIKMLKSVLGGDRKLYFYQGRLCWSQFIETKLQQLEHELFQKEELLGRRFSHLCLFEKERISKIKPSLEPVLTSLYEYLFWAETMVQTLLDYQTTSAIDDDDDEEIKGKKRDFLAGLSAKLEHFKSFENQSCLGPWAIQSNDALAFMESRKKSLSQGIYFKVLSRKIAKIADEILELILQIWQNHLAGDWENLANEQAFQNDLKGLVIVHRPTLPRAAKLQPIASLADGIVPGLAALLVLIFILWQGSTLGLSTIYIYNGLGTEVSVGIDGRSVELMPLFHDKIKLVPGRTYEVTTKNEKGLLIEKFQQRLSPQPAHEVYNVLGASPLQHWRPGQTGADYLGHPRWLITTADLVFDPLPKDENKQPALVLSGYGELPPRQMLKFFKGAERDEIIAIHKKWTDSDSQNYKLWQQF